MYWSLKFLSPHSPPPYPLLSLSLSLSLHTEKKRKKRFCTPSLSPSILILISISYLHSPLLFLLYIVSFSFLFSLLFSLFLFSPHCNITSLSLYHTNVKLNQSVEAGFHRVQFNKKLLSVSKGNNNKELKGEQENHTQ